MDEKQFARLQKACHKSLLRFEQESGETLRLLALVDQNPDCTGHRIELQAQLRRESKALAVYRGRVRKLAIAVSGAEVSIPE